MRKGKSDFIFHGRASFGEKIERNSQDERNEKASALYIAF
jgi:hypothetical protein